MKVIHLVELQLEALVIPTKFALFAYLFFKLIIRN